MWQVLTFVLLVTIVSLLWLSYEVASAFSLFGSSFIPEVLHVVAAAATAALFVVAAGQLILRVGFASYLRTEPTGLQRGLVLSVLIFAAVAVMLAHFGVDLSTILTTSALVTAIIGLSIQPTLGSLMSGLTVDRALGVGDGVSMNGETLEITSMTWRSVVCRRSDGATVIIPNAKLADNTLEILPRAQPTRAEVIIKVNPALAPHILRKMVDQIIADIDEVDLLRPVEVAATAAIGRHRVIFWVGHYSQRGGAEANFQHRAWYTLRREHPAESANAAGADAATVRAVEAASRTARSARGEHKISDAPADSLIEAGEILSYGNGERIILPERLDGHTCLLIGGTLAEALAPADAMAPAAVSRSQALPATVPGTRQAWLDRIQRRLALRIGPYAEHATRTAAANGASIAEVCAAVATEIDDPAEREAFIHEVNPPSERIHHSGLLFRSRRDGLQRLWSDPPLRAIEHAVIIAVPPSLLNGTSRPEKGPRASVKKAI